MNTLERKVEVIDKHHQLTIALMKDLAGKMGLELNQQQDGNSIRVGWIPKRIVQMAPGAARGLHLAK